MYRSEIDAFVAIVSAGRPRNVGPMQLLVGPATWYVAKGHGKAYRAAGAIEVVEVGGLIPSRNAALSDAWAGGWPCVQLSDDLKHLTLVDCEVGATTYRERIKTRMTFEQAVRELAIACEDTDAYLAGVAPSDNPLNYTPLRHINQSGFIVGDFMYIRPCGLYFDSTFRLKEDYDYTLQHLTQYGRVARCNHVLASFSHRTNMGGAVTFRSDTLEQMTIDDLVAKWGLRIRRRTAKPNEVLLRWDGGFYPLPAPRLRLQRSMQDKASVVPAPLSSITPAR